MMATATRGHAERGGLEDLDALHRERDPRRVEAQAALVVPRTTVAPSKTRRNGPTAICVPLEMKACDAGRPSSIVPFVVPRSRSRTPAASWTSSAWTATPWGGRARCRWWVAPDPKALAGQCDRLLAQDRELRQAGLFTAQEMEHLAADGHGVPALQTARSAVDAFAVHPRPAAGAQVLDLVYAAPAPDDGVPRRDTRAVDLQIAERVRADAQAVARDRMPLPRPQESRAERDSVGSDRGGPVQCHLRLAGLRRRAQRDDRIVWVTLSFH